MTYQSYELSRYIGDDTDQSTSFTVADDDAINCAHMLAAGFNTLSRNTLNGFVLAVVDTKAGTVEYDGKTEQIKRDEPWSFSSTMHFTADPDGDNIVTLFDNENGRLMYPGKFKFTGVDEAEKPEPKKIHRKVLEEAYAELQAVKEVLADAGVETIPADRGATDLRAVLRARDLEIEELRQTLVELAPARNAANEAARAELIAYVKHERAKWKAADDQAPVNHEHMRAWFRGVLDVLARFLVVIGEADASEGHAVARRLCEVPDGEV